jgi:hypothetical protein
MLFRPHLAPHVKDEYALNVCRYAVAVLLNVPCVDAFRCGDETPGDVSAGKILLKMW